MVFLRENNLKSAFPSELEAGVPEERFKRILPEGVKGGKTRRTEKGGSSGEGKDQDAEENRSTHA